MAYNVKFLKGTAAQYTGLASKDVNTFYFTSDDKNLYLGEIKLSNAADLAAAVLRIGQNETDIASIEEQLSTLLGGEGEGTSIQDMIDEAIATVQTQIGTLSSLNTTAKDNLVNAINEVRAAVSAGDTEAQVTLEEGTSADYAKVYTLKQGESTVGTINIPKDMVVKSGAVETDPAGQAPGTYIVLTLANATSDKIYVNVGTLVDIYTAQQSAAQVQLSINSRTREISATLVDGGVSEAKLAANAVTTAKIADGNVTEAKIAAGAVSSEKVAANAIVTAKIADGNVTKAKLATAVQSSLDAADSALQSADITTGATNGTVAVDGTDVAVKGLGTAAYTESSAYDAAGSANAVKTAVIGTADDTSTEDTIKGAKKYTDEAVAAVKVEWKTLE